MNDDVIYGYKNYTQIELGNVNILISVPHDGLLRPEDISDRRSDENGNLKSDLNTRIFAKYLREELSALFLINKNIMAKPFMIINNLHRIKMDPNRKYLDACYDCSEDSGLAYQDYHDKIEYYFGENFMLNSPFQQGLLIDIHGHNHKENWIELGYLLANHQLNKNLKEKLAKSSSINRLAALSEQPFTTLVRGSSYSLGGIIQAKFNLRVVPSPNHVGPHGANYYSGGFITEHYSSKEMAKYRLNCIQIELPASMRHDASVVEVNAKKIASCLFDYYFVNSFDSLANESK